MMKRLRNICAALAMAIPLAAAPAPAADCGDTAGPGGTDVPCGCGDTVMTDTRLGKRDPVVSKRLDDFCPEIGLEVAAGVDLDLGGRHIRGSLAVDQVCGIAIRGDGVTVRNGKISRFGDRFSFGPFSFGVCQLEGFNGATIVDLEFSEVPFGILVAGGTGHLVSRNRVNLDRFATGFGVFIVSTTSATVAQNVVEGARRGTIGVVADENSGLVLRENVVRFHGSGSLVSASNGALIEDNDVSDNKASGISIGGDSSTIRRNRFFRNGSLGLGVGGNGNVVTDNEVSEGRIEGLLVIGSGNTLAGNHVTRNPIRGLTAEGGGNIDGGGNVGTDNALPLPQFDPLQCQIDGVPCAP